MNFDEKLKRIEEIVNQMESENISLDCSMELYESGRALLQECQEHLGQVQGRVQLMRDGQLQPYSSENSAREGKE